MYTKMSWWTRIRLELLGGEASKREMLRREGIHWEKLKNVNSLKIKLSNLLRTTQPSILHFNPSAMTATIGSRPEYR